jgi:hypothetical protein
MRYAVNWTDVVSRCLEHSRTPFKKLFNSLPNLATDDTIPANHDIRAGNGSQEQIEQWYSELLKRLRGEHYQEPPKEKPKSLPQLHEAVRETVDEVKERLAKARNQEELSLGFIHGLYKIKSLLKQWETNDYT